MCEEKQTFVMRLCIYLYSKSAGLHYTTRCNTQFGTLEDGRDHRPKHVELIGIINKQLLLHLVGVYIIYVHDTRSNKYQI
jgi:hypothetical protein